MKTPKTYRKGQMFIREFPSGVKELYILTVMGVNHDGDAQMNLIGLKSGDRWTDSTPARKSSAVTDLEMERLFRNANFKPVEVDQIEVRVVDLKELVVRL